MNPGLILNFNNTNIYNNILSRGNLQKSASCFDVLKDFLYNRGLEKMIGEWLVEACINVNACHSVSLYAFSY